MNKDKLEKKLLFSSKGQLLSFIEKYFFYEEITSLKKLKESKRKLFNLDKEIIEHTIFRIESMEESSDPFKSLSAMSGLLVLIIGYVAKDYWGPLIASETNSLVKTVLNLFVILFITIPLGFVFKGSHHYQKDKEKLIYFKKILISILEQKTNSKSGKRTCRK
ncbi:hypothetical protein WBS53_29915 [Bacillus albus]|uniref:hypothetical protein n=1 Tax=Bacillus cereus group TaxID=86661 RepID=UPI0014199F2E|nr:MULTISPECIES: hypothetical protein [Bacillus cereus group]MDA2325735.1 hypothetical protein [Bacillus cereus group sp. Bc177]